MGTMMNWREEQKAMPRTQKPQQFATVGAVFADGVTLLFAGEAAPSTKHYRCNGTVTFAPGQRVKITKVSGTYVVEYPLQDAAAKGVANEADI